MRHPQMLHDVTTQRNRVAKRAQHVGPTVLRYVALKCCNRLAGA